MLRESRRGCCLRYLEQPYLTSCDEVLLRESFPKNAIYMKDGAYADLVSSLDPFLILDHHHERSTAQYSAAQISLCPLAASVQVFFSYRCTRSIVSVTMSYMLFRRHHTSNRVCSRRVHKLGLVIQYSFMRQTCCDMPHSPRTLFSTRSCWAQRESPNAG